MKRTPLFSAHQALGARFVDFGGWDMPVQYTSILDEHEAVRRRAGLFDVSHMGEVEIRGPHALATLQRLTVNDVSRLRDGQAQYSLLCHPSGGVVDDIIVHRLDAERFFLCINAGNTEKDVAWMRENIGGAELVDRSAELALLALQGPLSTAILAGLTDLDLKTVPRFELREDRVAGHPALVAHTGYTGEDGWEIYCDGAVAPSLWSTLLDAGGPHGVQAAGLGARDTLRLEAALPLYGHELDDETTPFEARLGWVVRLEKGDFIGRDALRRQKEAGIRRQLVGVALTGAGIPRQGYKLAKDGNEVGRITSGTKSPTLGKAIGLGYVATAFRDAGTALDVEIRGKNVAAEVVPIPFYRREVRGDS